MFSFFLPESWLEYEEDVEVVAMVDVVVVAVVLVVVEVLTYRRLI